MAVESAMGAKTLKPATAGLYDEDFAIWTSETARLLRERRFDEVDIEHVAEEIEDMGKRDKRELYSRLTVLIAHLLKWKWQPERKTKSWRSTIVTQRAELRRLFEQSPSLRAIVHDAADDVYSDAGSRDC
jgi:type II secretory pathway component PulM